MAWLSFDELKLERKRYDETVRRTPDVDVFCSSSHWILPAQNVYAPSAKPFIWRTDETYCVFMLIHIQPGVLCAMPLEIGWGLACPLIGSDPDRVVGGLASALKRSSLRPDYVLLTGLQADGALKQALERRFGGRIALGATQVCERRVADLSGGLEAFLAARSAKFRAEIRRAERKLDRGESTYEYVEDIDIETFLSRVVAVERESWKGRNDQGVDGDLPLEFYRQIVESLLENGVFRAVFIKRHGIDIGFAFGGVEGDLFRGLQLSYRASHARYSPGNMAQLKLIRHLIAAGIKTYDLGMEMPYKARWASMLQKTHSAMLAVD